MPIAEILKKLKKPFPDSQVYLKIQASSNDGSRILLVKYLNHAIVQERVNEASDNWQFEITELKREDKAWYCVGSLTIDDVKRSNAGEGNSPKASASDCFKRCAVLFGVGLELYLSGRIWIDADNRDIFGKARDGKPYLIIDNYKQLKDVTGKKVDEEPMEEETIEEEPIRKPNPPEPKGQAKELENDDKAFQEKLAIVGFCNDHVLNIAKVRNYFDLKTESGMVYADADKATLETFLRHIKNKVKKDKVAFIKELCEAWSQDDEGAEIEDEPLPF